MSAFTPEQEVRIRQIIREEDYLAVTADVRWEKNERGEPVVRVRTDRPIPDHVLIALHEEVGS